MLFLVFSIFLIGFLRSVSLIQFFWAILSRNLVENRWLGFNALFLVIETKEVFYRKLFKTFIFNFLIKIRNVLTKIPPKILFGVFFIPKLLFLCSFYLETLTTSDYCYSCYLFSLSLLYQRLYPWFLNYFLFYGNLFSLFKKINFRFENTAFFYQLNDIFVSFNQGFWLTSCFSLFPEANSKEQAKLFLKESFELYNKAFFPAKNWFIFSRILNCFKLRLLTLDFCLFLLTIWFISDNLSFFFFEKTTIYSFLFSVFILVWIYFNWSLFKLLKLRPDTMSYYFEFYILKPFSPYFQQFYKTPEKGKTRE